MDPRSVVTMHGGTPLRVVKPSGKNVLMVAKRWHVLETLAKAYGWHTYVELGVFQGWTIHHMLKHCPHLRVIGIDLYSQPRGIDAETYPANMEGLHREVADAIAKHGDRAQLLRMDTVEAADHFSWRTFDGVFIDADHRTPNVVADIEAWRPRVTPGGWLLGHDFHFPSVRAAVEAVLPPAVEFSDNVWGVRC